MHSVTIATGRARVARAAATALVAVIATTPVAAQSPSGWPTPISGPAFEQLVSDDGRLTLTVPLGLGPPLTDPSIVAVPAPLPGVAAYEVRPLGAALPEPISVTWRPGMSGAAPAPNGDLQWLGMASAGAIAGPWTWLDDPQVAVVDGDYSITGLLTRFGTLVVVPFPTRVHGPEAIWAAGYAPGRGTVIELDVTLSRPASDPGRASFSGDWWFGSGYPDRISVTTTRAQEDLLAATWQCLRTGQTSLSTGFGVRDDPEPSASHDALPGLGPTATSFSVTFPVNCSTVHVVPNG